MEKKLNHNLHIRRKEKKGFKALTANNGEEFYLVENNFLLRGDIYRGKVRLKTGKPKPISIAEFDDEEDALAGYDLPELPDDKAAQQAAMADMSGVQEPAPEDMYGDVTVSHGEKEPYTGVFEDDEPENEKDFDMGGDAPEVEPEKEIGGEIGMSPEDNDRMLQIAGIEKNGEEPVGDQIDGGKADEEDAQGFDPEQVLKGMEIEIIY